MYVVIIFYNQHNLTVKEVETKQSTRRDLKMEKVKKVAVVTSIASAVGIAAAKELTEQNYLVLGISGEKEMDSPNGKRVSLMEDVKVLTMDTTNEIEWIKAGLFLCEECVKAGSQLKIDLMINIPDFSRQDNFISLKSEELEETLKQGLHSTLAGIQSLFSYMGIDGKTRIVNLYPLAGVRSNTEEIVLGRKVVIGNLSSLITSASLNELTTALAAELKEFDVLVNSICPDSFSESGFYSYDDLNLDSTYIKNTLRTLDILVKGRRLNTTGKVYHIRDDGRVYCSGKIEATQISLKESGKIMGGVSYGY